MVDIDINVKMVLIPADVGSMHAYNYLIIIYLIIIIIIK